MKRIIVVFLAAVLTFCMTGCGEKNNNKMEEVEITFSQADTDTQDKFSSNSVLDGNTGEVNSEKNPETTYEEIVECYELDGPWHLDEKKFENVNFEDDFPGYAEWGSSMEIRSNGQISWYIGAEGWNGTYEYVQYGICADMKSDMDNTERTWEFYVIEDNGSANLKMIYGEYELIWMYGEPED